MPNDNKQFSLVDDAQRQLPIQQHEQLQKVIAALDVPTALMTLIHLTRDESFLDRFQPHLRSPMEGPSEIPAALDAELRSRLFEVLASDVPVHTEPLTQDLFIKMASISVGEPVTEEFVPLLLEQMGFEKPMPRKEIPNRPLPSTDFNVLVIGAGLTGLLAGIKLREAGYNYRIIEKNPDIGGTWFENVYPGVGVDTPSHFYSYSFAQNPNWSDYHPKGNEMQQYLLAVTDHFKLRSDITFETKVISCIFNEDSGKWRVTVQGPNGEQVIEANAVINAHGPVNRWSWPKLPGFDSFKGVKMHTAGWDPKVDIAGKRVALIGTGASAGQLGPAIADKVGHLTVYQRSKHWVLYNPAYAAKVSEETKWALQHIPFFAEWFRFRAYWFGSDGLYPNVKIDPEWPHQDRSISARNDMIRNYCLSHMNQVLDGRPDLIEKLTPDFPVFSKRIVLDGGWLAMMRRDNVSLEAEAIECVTEDSIMLRDGRKVPTDIIVCATGFDIAKMTGGMTIVGRDGRDLGQEWGEDDPRAYLGVTVPGYPNFFLTVGPNSAPNHAAGQNLISETQINYIIECLDLMVKNHARTMEPTHEAFVAFNDQIDRDLEGLVWTHPKARSYYRNAKGRVFLSNPYRLVDYWNMTRAPNADHYTIK